jgi:hypothetical protein
VKKILAGAVGGAAALAVIFGAGPAGADNEYEGRTFAQLQNDYGNRAVIASRTGSFLPTEQCIVTGNRRAKILDSSGNVSTKILVDLNCNDPMTAGHGGYSAATEQGKKAALYKGFSENWSKDFLAKVEKGEEPYCASREDRTANCRAVCKFTGTCAPELNDFLGL